MLEWMSSFLSKFGSLLIKVLPVSPFQPFISDISNLPYLGYLNWFFPVSDVLKVGAAWLASVALFYLYSVLMRWMKVIGD